jgi:hypothetical protein
LLHPLDLFDADASQPESSEKNLQGMVQCAHGFGAIGLGPQQQSE